VDPAARAAGGVDPGGVDPDGVDPGVDPGVDGAPGPDPPGVAGASTVSSVPESLERFFSTQPRA
jgi:hypothetical protein